MKWYINKDDLTFTKVSYFSQFSHIRSQASQYKLKYFSSESVKTCHFEVLTTVYSFESIGISMKEF